MVQEKEQLFVGLPDRKFDVVLIDPPWSYHGSQTKWGAAAKFYPTLTDDQIFSFPMTGILEKKAVVFVWATAPRLDCAMDAIRAWGLHYRGVAFTWVKTTLAGVPIGAQGVRPSIVKPTCEFVLAASTVKNGRPLSLASEAVKHVVMAPVSEHSRKPGEVHERIEQLYPDMSKAEIFARNDRDGWFCWGNEVGDRV